jgi:NADH-quinone oxidoreductase subunit E
LMLGRAVGVGCCGMHEVNVLEEVGDIVAACSADRGSLIPMLQEIQERLGYLCEEAVAELSRRTGISENEIYGVATFYEQFRFRPPGEHTICICQGTACHVRGGRQILAEVEQRLGVRPGETTEDGRFDLKRVACIGCCALAPTLTIDGEVHARMTPQKARGVIARYAAGEGAGG